MSQSQPHGIVGVSAEGAALCYRTICAEGAAFLGPHDHPEITLHTHPLAAYMRHVETGAGTRRQACSSTRRTGWSARARSCSICPDNTLHPAVELVRDRLPVAVDPHRRGGR